MPVGQGGGGGGRRATVRRQVDSVAELRTFHAPCRNLPAGTEASSRPRSCPPSTRSPSWTRRGHAPRCGRDARREISRDVPVHRRTVLEPASSPLGTLLRRRSATAAASSRGRSTKSARRVSRRRARATAPPGTATICHEHGWQLCLSRTPLRPPPLGTATTFTALTRAAPRFSSPR